MALSASINCCTQTIPVKLLVGARYPFGKIVPASVSDLVMVWALVEKPIKRLPINTANFNLLCQFFMVVTSITYLLKVINCVKTARPALASALPMAVSISDSA